MTTNYWRDFWGNAARRSNPYGSPPPPRVKYAKGYHRGEDITPRGGDLTIPALRPGRVARTGYAGPVGSWVAIDVGGGRFDIYCHVFAADRIPADTVVGAGDRVARMARINESPGTSWQGEHVHFVISDHPNGADSAYADFDPRPVISSTLASPPPPPDPISEEDLPLFTIRDPNGTIYFADEMGADHLGDYHSPDIGVGEFLGTAQRVFGAPEQLTQREMDIAVAIANRRWTRKKQEIVDAVVAALAAQP